MDFRHWYFRFRKRLSDVRRCLVYQGEEAVGFLRQSHARRRGYWIFVIFWEWDLSVLVEEAVGF